MSVILEPGDCLDVMLEMAAAGTLFDAVVTDPPYHLTSVVQRFGGANAKPAQHGSDGLYARQSKGFMQKSWDGGDVALRPDTWARVYDVMKPGAHLLAFGGSRTYHRMACAIEDAGFEVRDCIMWLYGVGFPKSHSVSKGLGDLACTCEASAERDMRCVHGDNVSATVHAASERGEVLQPGLSESGASFAGRSEFAPDARRGEPGMEGRRDATASARELRPGALRPLSAGVGEHGPGGRVCDGTPAGNGLLGGPAANPDGVRASQGPQPAEQRAGQSRTLAGQPKSQAGGAWPLCNGCGKPRVPSGFGTALKPAFEPIIVARKPLDATVAANVLAHGTGALNIDASRIPCAPGDKGEWPITGRSEMRGSMAGSMGQARTDHAAGRWPANVIHDGSDEVLEAFAAYGERTSGAWDGQRNTAKTKAVYGAFEGRTERAKVGDTGTAARFFYSAKASAADRADSKHPTVKPLALMRYLVTLVTPPGGTVLDPFSGSGTTLQAAAECGFNAVGIERDPEYQADILRRIARLQAAELEALCA